ncbi:Glutamine cyclotransferase [compost metagenome]
MPETTLRSSKSIDTQLLTGNLKLGLHRLAYTIYYDGDKSFADAVDFAVASNISPATHSLKITKEYDHNPANFTQGFQLIDGNIYEGNGMYGESSLQKYDLNTGKVIQKVDLDQRFFG